jgi:hypothetical protein
MPGMWRRWYRDLLEEMREDRERHERWWRVQMAEQKRRFDAIDAAMENDKRVTREIVLELQAARARDTDMLNEMRAQRQGLLRILDRLDGKDGPSPAGA